MNRILEHLLIHSFSKLLALLFTGLLGLTLLLTYLGFFESMEDRFIDLRFQTRPILNNRLPVIFKHPNQELNQNAVVMVEITDECLATYGKWPWTREHFAQLVRVLKRSQAKVIAFDISFFDLDNNASEHDDSFAIAIKEHGRVVLASELNKKMVFKAKNNVIELPGINSSQTGEIALSEILPHPKFAKSAQGKGFVNIHLVDGVVRTVPLFKRIDSSLHLSLAAQSLKSHLGEDVYRLEPDESFFLADYKVPLWDSHNRVGLADRLLTKGHSFDNNMFDQSVYLNYLGPTYSRYHSSVKISDVISKKEFDSRVFKDRVVIVGFNARSLDKKLTPYGVMPGLEVQATAIQNLLNKSFLSRNSNGFLFFFLLISSVLLLVINLRLELRIAVMFNIALSLLILLFSLWSFTRHWFILDTIPIIVQQWGMLVLVKLALLSRNLQLRMFHLQQLNLHSRELFTILEPDRLANSIFETMRRYTNCHDGVLVTIDQVSDQIEYTNFGHLPDEFMVGISRQDFRRQVFELFKQKGQLIRLYDAEPMLGENLPPSDIDALILPLEHKDKLYGLLILRKDSFADELKQLEPSFFTTLCQIVVAALENARLYRLATIDGLTGLFVRQFFDVQINKEFMRATRYDEKVGYLMSDIDHFKSFNDTYGHDMGDMVLRLVSDEIKKSIRNSDIAARYGGEELCVILPNTDREGSMNIAERIRKNIENLRIPYEGESITITCSIGVSSIPDNQPVDVKEFLKQADQALYEAKNSGRNQVKFYKRKKVGES